MPFYQHEETGGCVQTYFGNKPPSKRFYEITEDQYRMWLENQSNGLPTEIYNKDRTSCAQESGL